MHKCKCVYCKGEFDRDKLPYVQVTERRYAHKECAEKNQVNKSQSEMDYETLADYIEKLFGVGFINAKVAKQIRDFRIQYNYTYSGMLGTLVYWYEIKKAPIDKANGGIGIIPFVYKDALNYYYMIYLAQINNDTVKHEQKVREITIESPEIYVRPPRMFNVGEDE